MGGPIMMPDVHWTGVVRAGGWSCRMGRAKGLTEIVGISLLDRVVELLHPQCCEILVMGDPARHEAEGANVIPADVPGPGRLAGIITAMKRACYVRLPLLAGGPSPQLERPDRPLSLP
jgi:molybdopterin-guanine dinucleotide biosynthesis protein A